MKRLLIILSLTITIHSLKAQKLSWIKDNFYQLEIGLGEDLKVNHFADENITEDEIERHKARVNEIKNKNEFYITKSQEKIKNQRKRKDAENILSLYKMLYKYDKMSILDFKKAIKILKLSFHTIQYKNEKINFYIFTIN